MTCAELHLSNHTITHPIFEAALNRVFTQHWPPHHALADARALMAGYRAWKAFMEGPLEDGGLPMLKERHRKDLEDVAAGRRSARSLLAVGKGDLKGFTFTPNPDSEYERNGDGW